MVFTVPGKPKGKGRPRFTRSGHTYTPKDTKEYEEAVKSAYIEARGPYHEGYVSLQMVCYYPVPKSYSKKKTQQCIDGDIRPGKKPDIDNIIKAIADALNGVAYKDDAQIVFVRAEKWYTEMEPRVLVRLEEA